VKFPRTVRLDVSDANAFPLAAEPGEWAVTGTFAFADAGPETLSAKEQLAFKNGWLGTGTFGRATFVQVAVISEPELDDVVRCLARHLFEAYGAPDMLAATEAARAEALDTADVCDHPAGTLLGVEREFTGEGVSEKIRVIEPQGEGAHARIWSVVDDEN